MTAALSAAALLFDIVWDLALELEGPQQCLAQFPAIGKCIVVEEGLCRFWLPPEKPAKGRNDIMEIDGIDACVMRLKSTISVDGAAFLKRSQKPLRDSKCSFLLIGSGQSAITLIFAFRSSMKLATLMP